MFVHLCVFVLCFRPDLAARCISSKDLQALPNYQSPRWSSKFRIPQVETGESWKFYQKGHRRSAWNASEGVSRSQGVRSDRTMRRATTCFVPSCAVTHTTCFSEDQRVRRKAWFTEIHVRALPQRDQRVKEKREQLPVAQWPCDATWCQVLRICTACSLAQVQKRLKEDLAITHRDSLYEVSFYRTRPVRYYSET